MRPAKEDDGKPLLSAERGKLVDFVSSSSSSSSASSSPQRGRFHLDLWWKWVRSSYAQPFTPQLDGETFWYRKELGGNGKHKFDWLAQLRYAVPCAV